MLCSKHQLSSPLQKQFYFILQLSYPLHHKQGYKKKIYFDCFLHLNSGKTPSVSFFPFCFFFFCCCLIFCSLFKDVFIWAEPVFEIFWLSYTLLSSRWNVFLKKETNEREVVSILKNFGMLSQSRWKNKTVLVLKFQREGALRLQRGMMDISRRLWCAKKQTSFEWRQELLEFWFINTSICTVLCEQQTHGLMSLFSSRQRFLVLALGIV